MQTKGLWLIVFLIFRFGKLFYKIIWTIFKNMWFESSKKNLLDKGQRSGVTCLQLDRKTSVFDCRCLFMKVHSISNFWSRGTIITVCFKRVGVAVTDSSCTLIYSGSFKLSLARSWTDFVWVAEKSMVCLRFGNCEMIAFTSFLNPLSRIRSASSSTKTYNQKVHSILSYFAKR